MVNQGFSVVHFSFINSIRVPDMAHAGSREYLDSSVLKASPPAPTILTAPATPQAPAPTDTAPAGVAADSDAAAHDGQPPVATPAVVDPVEEGDSNHTRKRKRPKPKPARMNGSGKTQDSAPAPVGPTPRSSGRACQRTARTKGKDP